MIYSREAYGVVDRFCTALMWRWLSVDFRAGPPVPELSLSEDFVLSTASVFRNELNKGLAIARDIALGKDFKLFLMVSRPDLDAECGCI